MRTGRVLIGAVLFLGAGIWALFTYCHGNAGLNFSSELSGNKISLDLTTTGVPMIVGLALGSIGALLLLIAFIAAIVGQFRRPGTVAREEVSPRRDMPFEG